jgi:hypothetical protein
MATVTKNRIFVKLLLAMKLQLKFELILTYTKAAGTIKISSPLFLIFSLAAILVGSRDHRTQFWKGATNILGFSVKFFFQPIYTDYAN